MAINDAVPNGLVSSVYSRDVSRAYKAVEQITAGIVYMYAGIERPAPPG